MKPEELDELFRRGLADQQLPPRPAAWSALQQRLNAAHASTAEDDTLPAFLLRGAESTAPPAPFMTASRGGATASTASAAWWQRPALRVAAAVTLLVGGGALALRSGLAAYDATIATVAKIDVLAPSALKPTALAPAAEIRPEGEGSSDAVASATSAPEAASALAAVVATVSPQAPLATMRDRQAAVAATASAKPAAVVRRRLEPHLAAPTMVASAPTRRSSLDSQAVASRASQEARALAATSSLTVGEAADATLASVAPSARPAVGSPTGHGFVNVRRSELRDADEDETIEVDGGMVGQLVARATGRPARITSPNALLRRGAGRVRELLDRADHTADGQLTIETSVVGRAVHKTISL